MTAGMEVYPPVADPDGVDDTLTLPYISDRPSLSMT
jgi:hypothetical protein